MRTIDERHLIDSLKQLAFRVIRETEHDVSHGKVQPGEELYFVWKIDKFKYTEKGVTERSAHGDYVVKPSWLRASIKITDSIKKSKEYSSVLGLLTKIPLEKVKVVQGLDRFTGRLISMCLQEPKPEEADLDVLVSNFLKDIKDEPLNYGAEVELDGIVIIPKRIEFKVGDMNVILRQTRIEDLEKEIPVYPFSMRPFYRTPSAILSIEFPGRQANEIQWKVEQAIAILRLFKVGSVKYISYRMHSESFTDIMASGIVGAGAVVGPTDQSQITEADFQRLKQFWQTMIRAMPSSFYDIGETRFDYTTVAYYRYCDALLQDGLFERRIANAVMGLESLFLKGEESQELIYRLGIRLTKVFSLMGYDSFKPKELMEDAYRVRSLFVHGAHLSYKDKRKLNDKYKDIHSFLLLLLDCLRISIITMVCIKKEKEELLDLIDDALVSKDKEQQLDSLLNTAKPAISG